MSEQGPWPIGTAMVKAVVVALDEQDARPRRFQPLPVVFDQAVRPGMVVGPLDLSPEPDGYREWEVRLVPLVHCRRLAAAFSTAGLGWVPCKMRLRDGEVVDLIDDATGPYQARAVGAGQPRAGQWGTEGDTLLQVELTEAVPVPTLCVDPLGEGQQVLDVPVTDLDGRHAGLQVDGPVEMVSGAGVRRPRCHRLAPEQRGHRHSRRAGAGYRPVREGGLDRRRARADAIEEPAAHREGSNPDPARRTPSRSRRTRMDHRLGTRAHPVPDGRDSRYLPPAVVIARAARISGS